MYIENIAKIIMLSQNAESTLKFFEIIEDFKKHMIETEEAIIGKN